MCLSYAFGKYMLKSSLKWGCSFISKAKMVAVVDVFRSRNSNYGVEWFYANSSDNLALHAGSAIPLTYICQKTAKTTNTT